MCNDSTNEYLNGFLVFNKENERYISIDFKDPFFKQIFPLGEREDLFAEYVMKALPEDDENKIEILAYLERYRKAGSDHSGYYYVKSDYPCPTNIEIINGLQF